MSDNVSISAVTTSINRDADEDILKEELSRFVIFPINPKYQDLWDLYITHVRAFWVHDEIDYTSDLDDWNSLTDDERSFIEYILAFFAGSDGIVMENLVNNFCSEVKISEARSFYSFQTMIENIHGITYSLLIDTYVKDRKRRDRLFNAIENIPVVEKKARWAMKWMDKNRYSFGTRLVAFSIVEGVFFSGAFCSIFWLKDRNKMVKALGHSNELIARDEGLHVKFAVTLFHHLYNRPDEKTIHEMFKEAVEIEKEFILEAIPCDMIGMNKRSMSEYIEFVADRLLSQLGYSKIYDAKCPFDFMNKIGMDGKTNFFEKRVSEYVKSGEKTINSKSFAMDDMDDF